MNHVTLNLNHKIVLPSQKKAPNCAVYVALCDFFLVPSSLTEQISKQNLISN